MLVLGAADIEALLDLDAARASQRRAFECLALGLAQQPKRLLLEAPAGMALGFSYAARVEPGTGVVCKVGGVAEHNAADGLPSVSALVVALDPVTGVPAAILDGTAVTTLRTAAASAVAVERLAPGPARTLAIIGSGVQAHAHARALCRVRRFASVRLWSPNPGSRDSAVRRLGAELSAAAYAADSAEDAAAGADVVVACTTSSEPVLRAGWIADGALVVSIGSFAPDRCEVDRDLVRRAAMVVVDHAEIALEQAGPIVAAVAAGELEREALVTLGDVVTGTARRPDGLVFFNSVGLGVQDAAAAWAVVAAARDAGAGRTLTI